MDLIDKKALLKKYWKGETSPKETYFISNNISLFKDLLSEEEIQYFGTLKSFQKLELSSEFKANISTQLDTQKLPFIQKKSYQKILKIAAAGLLLLSVSSIGYYQYQQGQEQALLQKQATRKAFQTSKNALLLLSSKLNKTVSYTQAPMRQFELTKNKIKSKNNK